MLPAIIGIEGMHHNGQLLFYVEMESYKLFCSVWLGTMILLIASFPGALDIGTCLHTPLLIEI
jgi:hypothetical protein